jgi:hypothetical protein
MRVMNDTSNGGGSAPASGLPEAQLPIPPGEPTGPGQPPPGIEPPLPGEHIPPAGDPPKEEPVRLKEVAREVGGPAGPEPTRYGDWERKGRVSDF